LRSERACKSATILSLAPSAINFHIKQAMAELGAVNKTHPVAKAMTPGYLAAPRRLAPAAKDSLRLTQSAYNGWAGGNW